MIICHNIGTRDNPNYNTREELREALKLPIERDLTFDGIYRNVWENRDILAEHLEQGRKVILYFSGGYIGTNNSFDIMPHEMFTDWNQLMDLVLMGCKLGWHTWTHPDLTKVSDQRLTKEVTPPFKMEYFAYPYGIFDERVLRAVKAAGFTKAHAVHNGDNSDLQILRKFLRPKLNPA